MHPAEKDSARLVVRNALRCLDFGECERMVRINQGDLGLEDLAMIVAESPDLILIPKAETPDDVLRVDARIREVQDRDGMEDPIWLMPILESAPSVWRITPRTSAFGRR